MSWDLFFQTLIYAFVTIIGVVVTIGAWKGNGSK